jgi:hypothetical protein
VGKSAVVIPPADINLRVSKRSMRDSRTTERLGRRRNTLKPENDI